jgi:hypothetical protein
MLGLPLSPAASTISAVREHVLRYAADQLAVDGDLERPLRRQFRLGAEGLFHLGQQRLLFLGEIRALAEELVEPVGDRRDALVAQLGPEPVDCVAEHLLAACHALAERLRGLLFCTHRFGASFGELRHERVVAGAAIASANQRLDGLLAVSHDRAEVNLGVVPRSDLEPRAIGHVQ